jgi:FG-GAP-like repeat
MKSSSSCLLVLALVFLSACEKEMAREERLAKTYCSSCHQFPEPGLLDKQTWRESVLPQMAFRMGLDPSLISSIPEADHPFVLPALPAQPMVSEEEWQAIKNYFEREAPDSLTAVKEPGTSSLTQFDVELVSLPQNRFPLLSLLNAATLSKTIYVSNRSNWLHQYDFQFRLKDSIRLQSPVTSLIETENKSLLALQVGIMDPNDQPKGTLVKISSDKEIEFLIDSLKRPVHFERVDLNNDNLPDFVISSFGNYTGELAIFENLGEAGYRKHLINNLPGTRKVTIQDVNEDGLPDLVVMFTQGDEQISLFTNAGNFQFRINVLLRFPSVYGSSYFDVADFNKDGKFDLLYTHGDNADYSMILKPYHGVRLYLNDGKNQFNESWFYPMHGASQALAHDFDQDGDLDIGAISFFPDFTKKLDRSFIYFENNGGVFEAFTTPLASHGRWLLMETADLDGDSDEDILLSALDFNNGVPGAIVDEWKAKPVSLLVLRNNLFK